jgi:predicted enzyme related to lactoylglutathione lyase
MNNNPVGWFEIYVQDMNRARAFYESVLSTRLERMEGTDLDMWAFPAQRERPGAPGALVRMEGFASGHNSTLVYFTCADCAIEAKRAADSGGKVFKDKFAIGRHGFIALVTDTEGNLVELHSVR